MDDIAIFWDYENCPVPSNTSGYSIVNNICSIALAYGSIKTLKAYLEISEQTFSPRALTVRSELQSSGVSLVDCPHNGKKDVADKMIIVDMLAHAIDNPAPSTVMIITGDRDFAYSMSILRLRRYKVVLVTLSNAHSSLTAQASVCFNWNLDVLESPSHTCNKSLRSEYPPPVDRGTYHRERSLSDRTYEYPPPWRKNQEIPNNTGQAVPGTPRKGFPDIHQLRQSVEQRKNTVNVHDSPSPESYNNRYAPLPRVGMQNTNLPSSSTNTGINDPSAPLPRVGMQNTNLPPLSTNTGINDPSAPSQFQAVLSNQLRTESLHQIHESSAVNTTINNSTRLLVTASNKAVQTEGFAHKVVDPIRSKVAKSSQTSTPPSSLVENTSNPPQYYPPNDLAPSSDLPIPFSTRPASAPGIMHVSEEFFGKSAPVFTNLMSSTESLYNAWISPHNDASLNWVTAPASTSIPTKNAANLISDPQLTVVNASPFKDVAPGVTNIPLTSTSASLDISLNRFIPVSVAENSVTTAGQSIQPNKSAQQGREATSSTPFVDKPALTSQPTMLTAFASCQANTIPLQSTSSKFSASTDSNPLANTTSITLGPVIDQSTVPEIFVILVETLRKYRSKGVLKPPRSNIATEISNGGSTYKKAGVDTFKHYTALAAKQGIIILGGSEATAWIALSPKWS